MNRGKRRSAGQAENLARRSRRSSPIGQPGASGERRRLAHRRKADGREGSSVGPRGGGGAACARRARRLDGAAMEPSLSAYELLRNENICRNVEALRRLGIADARDALVGEARPRPRPKRKRDVLAVVEVLRRSPRLAQAGERASMREAAAPARATRRRLLERLPSPLSLPVARTARRSIEAEAAPRAPVVRAAGCDAPGAVWVDEDGLLRSSWRPCPPTVIG